MQLASVRRSLFNNTERACYLQQLAKGVQGILEAPQVRYNASLLRHRRTKTVYNLVLCFFLLSLWQTLTATMSSADCWSDSSPTTSLGNWWSSMTTLTFLSTLQSSPYLAYRFGVLPHTHACPVVSSLFACLQYMYMKLLKNHNFLNTSMT